MKAVYIAETVTSATPSGQVAYLQADAKLMPELIKAAQMTAK